MDDSQENLITTMPTVQGNFFSHLTNVLTAGLSYLYKQELKESIDFLRTLENIQVLDEHIPQSVLPGGPPVTEKNLLACTGSGEAQVLFFNISGSEFIDMYVGVGSARARELLAQAWHKALLHAEHLGHQIAVDKAYFHGRVQTHTKTPKQVDADLVNPANEATVMAARDDYDKGLEPDRILVEPATELNRNKKPKAGFSEAGHGMVDKHEPSGQPPPETSTISRDASVLGFTLQLPIEEKFLSTPVSLPEIWPVVWVLAAKIGSLTYSKHRQFRFLETGVSEYRNTRDATARLIDAEKNSVSRRS